MFDNCNSHSAAAKPPTGINTQRDPPNASYITVTWMEPTNGVIITSYMIYWTNGDKGNTTIMNGDELPVPTNARINVDPTEPVYRITMITLTTNDTLPSEESNPVYSET